MFDLAALKEAQRTVARAMPPTPQYRWPGLCRRAGCEVWVKHENHTPTGAFKVRGGLVLLDELARADKLPRRMVTATRGNHGQSAPFAAVPRGVAVTVFAPKGNSVEKNAAMLGWGAELVEVGTDYDEARQAADAYAEAEGALYVQPFHPALVRGVATYALELFTADRIKGEIYFGCAELDPLAPPSMIEPLEAHLATTGIDYRVEWYPGADHGFVFPQRGGKYDKPSAERHWERLFALFQRNL